MASNDIEQTIDDVANDAYQPLDDSTQTKDKDPKKDWFKQPPMPPTPDPEWNKHQVVKILSVVSVSVKKLHGYGHLEEIAMKRADRQVYKFKEGDFIDLHLNNIEDMLLLVVQHKLFQLNGSDIVDLIVALFMLTRSLIIKRRVEDLQLGVESYQKKLNIITPQKTFPRIEFKESTIHHTNH
nr:hypothetical protein [Tanacetum cinerariifolium]